jgi:hypothetical protein
MTTYSTADLYRLVLAAKAKGLDHGEAVAKISRETGERGSTVMNAVMAERDK